MSTPLHRRPTRRPAKKYHSDDNPKLNLTADEKRYFGQLFNQVKTDADIVPAEKGGKLFRTSRLDEDHLFHIWTLSDPTDRGYLTSEDFVKALRLIGRAQAQPNQKLNDTLALERKLFSSLLM